MSSEQLVMFGERPKRKKKVRVTPQMIQALLDRLGPRPVWR